MTEAYPLAWPAGRPRTPLGQRKRAQFKKYGNRISVYEAIERLQREIEVMQSSMRSRRWKPVVSTNIETRNDGLPRSDRRDPDDVGVAVYFRSGEKDYCMPCDRWDRVADNIAAIAGHIEAIRRIERYGVQTLDAAFAGFEALPAPGNRPWRQVLELHRANGVTLPDVEAAFRSLARQRHPDHGGSHEMMAELNAAIEQARRELGA